MFEYESKEWRVLDVYPFVADGEEPRGFDMRVTAIPGDARFEELPRLVKFGGYRSDFKTLEEWQEYNAKINAAVERCFAWLAEQQPREGGV